MRTFLMIRNTNSLNNSELSDIYNKVKIKNKHNYVPPIGSRISVKNNSYDIISIHYDFDDNELTIIVR